MSWHGTCLFGFNCCLLPQFFVCNLFNATMANINSLDSYFFLELGLIVIGANKHGRARSSEESRFLAHYGTHPSVVAVVWAKLVEVENLHPSCKPKHLLWTLLFFKTYGSFDVIACHVGADPKTVRKWIWHTVHQIADLIDDVVSGTSLFSVASS